MGPPKGIQAWLEWVGYLEMIMGSGLGDLYISVGITSSIHVELWAVMIGLETFWDLSYQKVILEVDSAVVARALTSQCTLV